MSCYGPNDIIIITVMTVFSDIYFGYTHSVVVVLIITRSVTNDAWPSNTTSSSRATELYIAHNVMNLVIEYDI